MPPRHAGEPPRKPVLLTTLSEEKLRLLKRFGMRSRPGARLRPKDRVHELRKISSVRPSCAAIGPWKWWSVRAWLSDADAPGVCRFLRRLGREHGVRIHVVSQHSGRQTGPFLPGASARSSPAGNIEKANALLGYPYSVSGAVVHGDHRGRQLGFPTANIQVQLRRK